MVKVKFVYVSICFLIFAFVAAYAKKQVGRETIFIDCIKVWQTAHDKLIQR